MTKHNAILVVDDAADDVFRLRQGFEKACISVPLDWIPDGQQAVSYLLRAAGSGFIPSVLLLETNMPKMDGFSVLKWLAKHPQFDDMAVLMLSSSAFEEDQTKAKELGAKAYFVKPTDPQEYIALARNVVRYWESPGTDQSGRLPTAA